MTRRSSLFVPVALMLAGCVAQGPFPSLAPRPAEQIDMSVDPVREAPEVANDAALRREIEALASEARGGWRDFEAELGVAERAAAAAGPRGSESWVAAQQAVSRLEAARARTMAAAAELERLSLARADLPTSAADQEALAAAIAEVSAIATRQQQLIDRIRRD